MAVTAIAYWQLTGRPLGVSGSLNRVLRRYEEPEVERKDGLLASNSEALDAAILEATQEEFGEAAVQHLTKASSTTHIGASYISWTSHLAFLMSAVIGSACATLVYGSSPATFSLGETFHADFGTGTTSWLVLILGGWLAGFGTRMAGGCTSGHGLSGCSSLWTSSLVATAVFFGTAVAFSFLLDAML